MSEFSIIETFFASLTPKRSDVLLSIGDDAACVVVPLGMNLLVSTDTLVADVHFLSSWNAYDIGYKAAMVNISDIVAMGASPSWATLNLTLPNISTIWLQDFSRGLRDVFNLSKVALIGGDTTAGPLSITLTMMGIIPNGRAITRGGAHVGDRIYVTGTLGAAALAVYLKDHLDPKDYTIAFDRLRHPQACLDWIPYVQEFASAAIDISDGLSADLYHICQQSGLGANLYLEAIPVDPLVQKYSKFLLPFVTVKNPITKSISLDFAMTSGDDYELCFTVSADKEAMFLKETSRAGLSCYCIGVMDAAPELRGQYADGQTIAIPPQGYQHFAK